MRSHIRVSGDVSYVAHHNPTNTYPAATPTPIRNALPTVRDDGRTKRKGIPVPGGLTPLLHHQPAALLRAQVERPNGRGFGCLPTRRFHVTEDLRLASDERCAPALGGDSLSLARQHSTQTRRHGWYAGPNLGP